MVYDGPLKIKSPNLSICTSRQNMYINFVLSCLYLYRNNLKPKYLYYVFAIRENIPLIRYALSNDHKLLSIESYDESIQCIFNLRSICL